MFGRLGMASLVLWLASAGVVLAQGQLKSIIINSGTPQIQTTNAAVFAVPETMGFWAAEGMTVKTEGTSGAGPALQQLIAKKVEMTVTGAPSAMELINQGAPIVIVGSEYAQNVYYPATLADSPIKTIEDFRGKTIGLSGLASTNAMWVKALLKLDGIDADKELTLVSTGEGAGALQALLAKRVDILQLYEAMYDTYEAQGIKMRRFNDATGLDKLSFTQAFVVRSDTLKNDPQEVVGLLRGMAKGAIWSQDHVEDAVHMHWKLYPLMKQQNVEEAKALADSASVLKRVMSHFTTWAPPNKFGYASPESVETVRDTLKSIGILTKALPAKDYFDPSLIDEVNAFDAKAVTALPPKN